ncbi:MAG: hypothetical protein JXR25_01580 [Pontiellaceae bacterium]|nr:hypothetical protein [Pontiellaceae bacterium]MBN2783490.1 hypothetical protein [Pontiellaceae bacterium]
MGKNIIIGHMLYYINRVLQLPFYNPLTKELVATYLSGRAAHLVFFANAFVWGIGIWFIVRNIQARRLEQQAGRTPDVPPIPVMDEAPGQ